MTQKEGKSHAMCGDKVERALFHGVKVSINLFYSILLLGLGLKVCGSQQASIAGAAALLLHSVCASH